MIIKSLELGPFLSNCYIVGSEKTKEGIIIDPGAEAKVILNTAKESGLKIILIALTHTHIDHIGALVQVKQATQAPLAVHHAEKDGVGTDSALAQLFAPLLEGLSTSLPPVDRLLSEGDIVEVGELRFKVLHTPGHSPGGICLLGHGVVFCGDTLFNFSIGRTDFPGCSYEQLMKSIYTKLMTLPDETEVFPGHGPQTTIGFERKHNPFLR
jgi:glyoxylase-like metal-dependent hydrolase (beta-lactamase superfamily II)